MRPARLIAGLILGMSLAACAPGSDQPPADDERGMTSTAVRCAAPRDDPLDRSLCAVLVALRETHELPGASAALVFPDGGPRTAQVERRFLDPLGLAATGPQNGFVFPGLAQGYFPLALLDGVPPWWRETFEGFLHVDGDVGRMLRDGRLRLNPILEHGGGGFVSTPTDLARWARVLYGGTLLPDPYLEELTRAATSVPVDDYLADRVDAQRYGLGTQILETPHGRVLGHGGYFPGYLSGMAYYERSGHAFAIQVNEVVDGLDLAVVLLSVLEN